MIKQHLMLRAAHRAAARIVRLWNTFRRQGAGRRHTIAKRAGAAIALSLSAAILTTGCGAGSSRLMFGTGGTAGTYYSYGGIIAQYMTRYGGAKVTAVSTGGSKVNIQSVQDGDFQLGFSQSDVMTYAWNGT